MGWCLSLISWALLVSVAVIMHIPQVKDLISSFLYKMVKSNIPKLSKTEEQALNAGDTWLEEDLFKGQPNWKRLHDIPEHQLSEQEQAFLDNEVHTLCGMLDDWQISQDCDLPPKVWDYMKKNRFFGLVIDKKYGGLGFSAKAHSDIVMKLATRSSVAAVTVMVPNSLGPGELLHYYGTDEQKKQYLPKLATGEEIPCFALTEPGAGRDATSIRSEAIVVKKKIDNKMTLGLSITLNKRWITLAPLASLIGLAVDLKDPNGLLKGVGEEGITCVLIPRNTKNLEIGNRHIPANQHFMNGTIRGKDIFVPIDTIIGGQKMAGQGWQMLVECLSIGRSISLPALGTASSCVAYLSTSAYAKIRRQFSIEIGKFEGVEEKIAEIAGLTYLINATRQLTVQAVDEHKKPSVASAITKYFNTENARIAVNDAMDIHAGRTVVLGPNNYLANYYMSAPISITVEGANIMTRNLLMFGQGSMACHPFVREEFYAISNEDKKQFSKLLWAHIAYFMRNMARCVCSAFTGGLFVSAPNNGMKRSYKKLARLSHAFSWIADLSLITLGGELKRKERLSARLGDALGYLYMSMAVLKMYHDNDDNEHQKVHAMWAADYCFYHAQKAMLDYTRNFPNKALGILMRILAFPWGQTMKPASDKLESKLARLAMKNNHFRNRMKKNIFLTESPNDALDKVELAFQAILDNEHLYQKISDLKRYKFGCLKQRLAEKVEKGEMTKEEMDELVRVEKMRWDAVQVDEFDFDMVKKGKFDTLINEHQSPLD